MNLSQSRGFAVLSFLACTALPCAKAISIVQTSTKSFLEYATGSAIGPLNSFWTFAQYAGSAPLESVVFEAHVNATISSVGANPSIGPGGTPTITFTPNVWLISRFTLETAPSLPAISNAAAGSPVVLGPTDSFSFSAPFAQSIVKTFTTSAEFADFNGSHGVNRLLYLGQFWGDNRNGGATFAGDVVMSLTFNTVEGVPDGSATAALLFSVCCGLFGFHRRMNRSLPTE